MGRRVLGDRRRGMSEPLNSISDEFVSENQKLAQTIPKKRGGPYTKPERQKRRAEVYKLHILHGWPSTRIAEAMNVNRHTIDDDIKEIYRKMYGNGRFHEAYASIMLEKQIDRLEAQRTRLLEYLDNTKELEQKLTVERLIFDIDTRLAHIMQNAYSTNDKVEELALSRLNEWAKEHNVEQRWIRAYPKILSGHYW